MKSKLLALFVFLGITFPALGQVSDTLAWSDFAKIIRKNHPIALRANILDALSRARIQQAWGNFDPKLSLNYDQKLFDGISYYQFVTPEIKVPLWYGVELKGNYSEAEGSYLSPESKLPQEGLSTVAFNISLGKGLLMDKRRAVLKQARIFNEASNNEQLRMLNDLMLDAGDAYLNWQNRYRVNEVYKNALQLSVKRFEAVKAGFQQGDRPAIDTTEALTQVQQRQIQLQQTNMELQNALYGLSSFLWLEDSQPVNADMLNIIPQTGDAIIANPQLSINDNPKILSYQFKIQDLLIERRLKAESLRPTVDLQIGLLNSGNNAFRNLNPSHWQNNNKIGLHIAFPLTFSGARGELAEARIKIRDTQLEEEQVRNDLTVKMSQNKAEQSALQEQLFILKQTLEAHLKLLAGEEVKFKYGDSSLFLINARESKLLEVQEKLIEAENKIRKNTLKSLWLAGGGWN